jgi:glycosyltransferase involved in cell wall biosynthesis
MILQGQGSRFTGRVGLQQRVLPAYRAPFFDRLAEACEGGLSVFAGAPRPDEAILTTDQLGYAHFVAARNAHILRGSFYLCAQLGVEEWLYQWDPEVLILEANPRYVGSGRAIRWMHSRGRSVIGWGLGAPPIRGFGAVLRSFARRTFLSRFDAILAYSSVGAQQYQEAGFTKERIFVAPNAVSPRPGPLPERPLRSEGPAKVIFVGRLQARKRVDLLLKACAALPAQPELYIVGDGPARSDLEHIAKRVFPRAQFLGTKQGADLGSLFDQVDLFVLPGTGGLAVQQAMAHGLPVIVAEGDGTQRDLVSGGNGWLVQPGDGQALTATLQEALSDPVALRERGRSSHRLAQERFNIDAMVEAFIAALRFVCEDR